MGRSIRRGQATGPKAQAKRPLKKTGKDKMLDRLRGYVRSHAERWLDDPNITSVGIGFKKTKGKATSDLSIQFTVGTKAAPEQLESLRTEPIPRTIEIDGLQ